LKLSCGTATVLFAFLLLGLLSSASIGQTATPLEQRLPLVKLTEIPLPNVEGRIDHLTYDSVGQRLFVAALGNHSVEIVDVNKSRWLKSIKTPNEPQGVLFISEFNILAVSCGGDGSVITYDGTTLQEKSRADFGDDADNLRYDGSSKTICVGYGNGGIGRVDPKKGTRVSGDAPLKAHPESFQISSGGSFYVNVPDKQEIVVVSHEDGVHDTTWALPCGGNFPMALDETYHRLFVACRSNSKLMIFDDQTGGIVASLSCPGDADDIYYDEAAGRLYVSGGSGFISVIKQEDADHYSLLQELPTAAGARTSLFVSQTRLLFLAVPHRGNQRAAIWVFRAN
jgi:WD40 repeat protein